MEKRAVNGALREAEITAYPPLHCSADDSQPEALKSFPVPFCINCVWGVAGTERFNNQGPLWPILANLSQSSPTTCIMHYSHVHVLARNTVCVCVCVCVCAQPPLHEKLPCRHTYSIIKFQTLKKKRLQEKPCSETVVSIFHTATNLWSHSTDNASF